MNRPPLTALPGFNEESHIHSVLNEVRAYSSEILVVDDGSTDNTAERLRAEPDITIITHKKNRGYGAALRSAFDFAVQNDFEALVTIDCDGQHQPQLIPKLAGRLDDEDGPYDIVSGSRYLQQFSDNSLPPEERRKINVEVTKILNERLGFNLTDTFCGFKAYRVEALPKLEITELGYAMPLQLWIQAAAADMRIVEFPVPLVYLEEERSFGGSLDDGRRRMAYYLELINRELAVSQQNRPQND